MYHPLKVGGNENQPNEEIMFAHGCYTAEDTTVLYPVPLPANPAGDLRESIFMSCSLGMRIKVTDIFLQTAYSTAHATMAPGTNQVA